MKIVKRPWGDFKEFAKNKKCTVKILEINPKQELSLQFHNQRAELWYFLDKAIVQLGSKKIQVKEGSIIKIPRKKAHRIIAMNTKARVLEVSFGNFSEKDEIRLEDAYGRK